MHKTKTASIPCALPPNLALMDEYLILYNGGKIKKDFFENRLAELLEENWTKKPIAELNTDHILCVLTFDTISPKVDAYYYESNKGSAISVKAFETYILPKLNSTA
jgi:hypothetical protein